jgi:hypothetical protein
LGHSHSIINEPRKLLICNVLAAALKILTVTFAVNLSGTSIGAGFRAVRPKLTFRDLLRSIGGHGDDQRHGALSAAAWEAPE